MFSYLFLLATPKNVPKIGMSEHDKIRNMKARNSICFGSWLDAIDLEFDQFIKIWYFQFTG